MLQKFKSPIVRDVIGIGAVKLIAIPTTLGITIMLARNLGPSDYGIYAFSLSLTSVMALLLTGGLTQLITREVAFALEDQARGLLKGLIRSATVWGLSSSLIIIFCVWMVLNVLVPDIDQPFHAPIFVSFLSLPIVALSPVWAGTLRGYGFGAMSQYPSLLLAPLIQLLVVAVLLWLNLLSVPSAILAFLVANAFAAAAGLYHMRKTVSGSLNGIAAEYQISSWVKSTAVFSGIALITFLNTQLGVLLLGFISTSADVAAFQIADRGAQLVILAAAIIELVIAPHVAKAHKAASIDRLQSMFRISRRVGGGVTLIIALPLIFAGNPIIHLVFGSDYVDLAVKPLAIISAALAFRSMLGPTSTFLAMTGNEKTTFAAHGLALLVNVLITLALAPKLGAEGAAWASACGIVIWSGFLYLALQNRLNIRVFQRNQGTPWWGIKNRRNN